MDSCCGRPTRRFDMQAGSVALTLTTCERCEGRNWTMDGNPAARPQVLAAIAAMPRPVGARRAALTPSR